MVFSKGFIFRRGESIEKFGDRVGHVKIFGVFIFGWLSWPIRRIGLKIKGSV